MWRYRSTYQMPSVNTWHLGCDPEVLSVSMSLVLSVCCARFFGGVFQPVLGAVNYIAGPIKPNPKPIELPTGT